MPREKPTDPNATRCSHPSTDTVELSFVKIRPEPRPSLNCGSNVNQATGKWKEQKIKTASVNGKIYISI